MSSRICVRCVARVSRSVWRPWHAWGPAAAANAPEVAGADVQCLLCADLLLARNVAALVASLPQHWAGGAAASWRNVGRLRSVSVQIPLALDVLRPHWLAHSPAWRAVLDKHLPSQQQQQQQMYAGSVREWLRRDIEHAFAEAHGVPVKLVVVSEGIPKALGRPDGIDIALAANSAELDAELEAVLDGKLRARTVRKNGVKGKQWPSKTQVQGLLDANASDSTSPPDPQHFAVAAANVAWEIAITHEPVLLGGRYNKYRRDVSQTPFFAAAGRGKICEESVSGFMEPVLRAAFGAQGFNMHASGREDMDVRMLGRGRPFYAELKNPTIFPWTELERISAEINAAASADPAATGAPAPLTDGGEEELALDEADVQRSRAQRAMVRDLHFVRPESIVKIKLAESDKRKRYRCFVRAPCPLDASAALPAFQARLPITLQIEQRTPQRVSHRRADLVRRREIVLQHVVPASDNSFILDLESAAGAYIKEFVTSDEGRTTPSLRDVMAPHLPTDMTADMEITRLDVLDVLLEWPTSEDIIA